MGKYINQDSKNNAIGNTYQQKVNALIADGAEVLDPSKVEFQLTDFLLFSHSTHLYQYQKEQTS